MNGQYEKNPNGGYLNKSNYGADSWYGPVTITPELLQQIHLTGKVLIEVKDIQTTQYGDCRRIVAKQYTGQQASANATYGAPSAAPQGQQGYANAGNGYAQAPAPAQAPTQSAPPPMQAAPAAPYPAQVPQAPQGGPVGYNNQQPAPVNHGVADDSIPF